MLDAIPFSCILSYFILFWNWDHLLPDHTPSPTYQKLRFSKQPFDNINFFEHPAEMFKLIKFNKRLNTQACAVI